MTTAKIRSMLFISLCLGLLTNSQAQESSGPTDPDVIDWELAKERVAIISPMGYHPFLMPLIMQNRDFIGMTDEQKDIFMEWRDENRPELLATMNKIIKARVDFHRISLNPETSDEVLLSKQAEIFKLQKKVLRLQISCRRNILDNFDEEQMDNFRFVLIDHGYQLDW